MSQRGKLLLDIRDAIKAAHRQAEMDWPRSRLDDPMLTDNQRMLYQSRIRDAGHLATGAKIIDSMVDKADGFSTLITLAMKKPADFDALVVLAQIELDRKPEAVAA